jgi:hypothetical protein
LAYINANSSFNIVTSYQAINNSVTLEYFKTNITNYTGRNEFEDNIYKVLRDDNGNIQTTDNQNDSYGSLLLADKNDTIEYDFIVPKTTGYNITIRLRTGTTANNPYILADLINYYIDGVYYASNSSNASTINTSSLYFVNDTVDVVWGFQRIANIQLTEGLHNLTVMHNDGGTTGIRLDYFTIEYNDTVINDSNYYNSPRMLNGNSAWSNFMWQNNSIPAGTTIGWCVYANDIYNNWNGTSCADPFNFVTT